MAELPPQQSILVRGVTTEHSFRREEAHTPWQPHSTLYSTAAVPFRARIRSPSDSPSKAPCLSRRNLEALPGTIGLLGIRLQVVDWDDLARPGPSRSITPGRTRTCNRRIRNRFLASQTFVARGKAARTYAGRQNISGSASLIGFTGNFNDLPAYLCQWQSCVYCDEARLLACRKRWPWAYGCNPRTDKARQGEHTR